MTGVEASVEGGGRVSSGRRSASAKPSGEERSNKRRSNNTRPSGGTEDRSPRRSATEEATPKGGDGGETGYIVYESNSANTTLKNTVNVLPAW